MSKTIIAKSNAKRQIGRSKELAVAAAQKGPGSGPQGAAIATMEGFSAFAFAAASSLEYRGGVRRLLGRQIEAWK